ncbi:MAG TPA: glycosyltransferase family 87 protein [Rubrobacteraceae bacterium]|nr:glycosyltransferase family 87 protein [Rubrobacteraceae bacterium]
MAEKNGSSLTAIKPAPVLAALIAAHTLVYLAVTYLAVSNGPAFQVEIFREYADKISAGNLPYADFLYEYPPLSLFILILPRLLVSDPAAYAALFGAEMLLFDIIILLALSRIGVKPLLLYGVGLLLFWRLPYIRHDLVPVACATTGALLLLRGRTLWAAALWGVGGAIKLYPIVAVPALAAGAALRQTAARWAVAGAVFAGGILWGIPAFGPRALEFLTYHSDRPAMIESLPANLLLLLPGGRVTHSFGSFNVVGPLGDSLVGFFEVFQLVVTVLALLVVWRQGHGAEPRTVAVRGAAVATFAFAVFGKVLSPHFLFWPLPLVAISTALGGLRFPRATWALYFTVILVTTAINEQYWAIDENLPYFTAMLTARNLLLLPLFGLLLLRPPEDQEEQKHRAHTGGNDQRIR